MNALINNINVEFIIENEVVFCDTLKLARVFEQEHKSVLRTIKNLPFSDFNEQNFKLVSYIDSRGRKQPCYNLTRDGFSLLVMGFTGEKAYKWKIEFIKAFNMMEAELKRLSVSRYVDEISSLNAILINKAKHHHRQIMGYKSQLKQHNNQIVILRHELAKYDKAHECEVIDESDPRFKPFSRFHPSYKELFAEFISVQGNNNALKIFIEQYKREVAELKEQLKNNEKCEKIGIELAKIHQHIGALASYAVYDDKYFLEHNQITKDAK